jgi:phenylacetate-CoA ligase
VYLEIINESKIAQEPDCEGRIVVTSLRNFGFPLIRYDIEDFGALSEIECTCGIRLPLLQRINGRTSDFVLTNSGKKIHSEFFSYLNRELLSRGYALKEFKIVQKEINELNVYLLKEEEANKKAVVFISDMIEKHIDPSMSVTFDFVEKIDSEKSGKKRYFVNEISS